VVDLGSFVTTSLSNVHLDVVEALDGVADHSVTPTPSRAARFHYFDNRVIEAN